MKKVYNKLVRDKIPEIIRADGAKPTTRTLNDDEYLAALIEKLKEELDEFAADHSLEELADIQEVINALCEAVGKTNAQLENAREAKAVKNGAFSKRILLKEVDKD